MFVYYNQDMYDRGTTYSHFNYYNKFEIKDFKNAYNEENWRNQGS